MLHKICLTNAFKCASILSILFTWSTLADPVLKIQNLTNGVVKVSLASALDERYDLQTNAVQSSNGWAIFPAQNNYNSNVRDYIFTDTNVPALFFRPVFRTFVPR